MNASNSIKNTLKRDDFFKIDSVEVEDLGHESDMFVSGFKIYIPEKINFKERKNPEKKFLEQDLKSKRLCF